MKTLGVLLAASSALLLASCDRNATPVTGYSVSGTVVQGRQQVTANGTPSITITPWEGGAGSVVASLSSFDSTAGSEIARTTLTADGKFNLSVPSPAAAQLGNLDFSDIEDLVASCGGTLTVSNRDVRGVGLALSVDANLDGVIFPATGTSVVEGETLVSTGSFGGLIYVDRDVTVEGSQTCNDDASSISIDVRLTLNQGWNKTSSTSRVELDRTDQVVKATVTLRSGSFPTDNWVYLDGTSATPLGLQSLGMPKVSLFR